MKKWTLGFAHKGLLSDGFAMISVYKNCNRVVPVFGEEGELRNLQNDMKIFSRGDMNCIVTCFDEDSAATQEGEYAALAIEMPPTEGKSLKCVRFRLRDGMPVLEPVETSTVQSVEELPEGNPPLCKVLRNFLRVICTEQKHIIAHIFVLIILDEFTHLTK